MKTGLIIVATFLLIIGLFMLALRLFFSMSIPNLGFANIDVICIFIPVIFIIFGIVLFILSMKATDLHIKQEAVTQKDDTKDDAMKMLDTRFAKGEITKEQYNEMKKEIKN
jgi:uncharacterized membrane protein